MKILITGATSGIGSASAELLASQGHDLILTGRRKDRLEKLKKKLTTKKSNIKISVFDVQSKSQVQRFLKDFSKEIKKLDLLINNAGLALGTEKIFEGKLEDWEVMMQTNVMGLLYLTRGVLPAMIANKKGQIINIGSVGGRWVYPGGAVYCASKFAVRALSEAMRMDLQGKNIRVSNIEPGMVNTDFSLVRFRDVKKAQAVYEGMKPLTAKDIAETILWVMNRPDHVNVQELVIFPTAQAAVGMVHRN